MRYAASCMLVPLCCLLGCSGRASVHPVEGRVLVDGRPAAFAYNYHFHGKLTGVRVGYDPTLGISGLGTALVLRSIEDSCERGDVSLDLGAGETQFKKRLRTHSESTYRATYVPLVSWRSQAVRLSRWAKRLAPVEIETGKAASA